MVRKRIHWIAGAIALAFLVLAVGGVFAAWQAPEPKVETQDAGGGSPPSTRQKDSLPDAPSISFIDSPEPTCYLPVRGTDTCLITWNYMYVDASPSYMISMSVDIDGQKRGYVQGFFQTSIYVPYSMTGTGYRVACGTPGVDGNPSFGNAYNYTIRARASDGLTSANYGSVYCPSDVVSIADVNVSGPDTAYVNSTHAYIASVVPITSTLPVTYTWHVTDHSDQTTVSGSSDTVDLSWNTPGVKTITVDAENMAGTTSTIFWVDVKPYAVYLPFARRK